VDLISDVLPFGRLSHGRPDATSNAIGHAQHYNRSYDRFKFTKRAELFVGVHNKAALILSVAGPEEAATNLAGSEVLRLIQIRLGGSYENPRHSCQAKACYRQAVSRPTDC
jgi:hypothetical protein